MNFINGDRDAFVHNETFFGQHRDEQSFFHFSSVWMFFIFVTMLNVLSFVIVIFVCVL